MDTRSQVRTMMQKLDASLAAQSAAAHAGDASALCAAAEESLALLCQLRDAGPPPAAELRRYRDAAAYNQVLLRCALTSWAAARLDQRRAGRATGYDARGQHRVPASPAPVVRARLGVL